MVNNSTNMMTQEEQPPITLTHWTQKGPRQMEL